MEQFEYFGILLLLMIWALALKYKYRVRVFRSRRQAIKFFLFVMVLGTAWDQLAIFRGHWSYSRVAGIYIGYMPLEDYFFMVIPVFLCLVVYNIMRR